jgi:sulfur-oxidizing protein SoxX
MLSKSISKAAAILFASALAMSSSMSLAGDRSKYTAMSPEELAEYLIFDAEGFLLDQKTQEGGTVRDRQTQDEIQKACSALMGGNIDGATASKVTAKARESMKQPDGGIKLGDWKKGEEVARSGYGYRVGHKVDDHSARDPGGNCYACHELDPDEIAYGTLGPSLKGYGRIRGTSDAILKYTYEVIYNPHAYFPCTHMPRFGANGVLTQQQIRDVMAYLLDPDSPVNQEK